MSEESTTTAAAAVLETNMHVRIAAPPANVWQALTDDIGAWWPQEFYAKQLQVMGTTFPNWGGPKPEWKD